MFFFLFKTVIERSEEEKVLASSSLFLDLNGRKREKEREERKRKKKKERKRTKSVPRSFYAEVMIILFK